MPYHEWRAPYVDVRFLDFDKPMKCRDIGTNKTWPKIPWEEGRLCAGMKSGISLFYEGYTQTTQFLEKPERQYKYGKYFNMSGPGNFSVAIEHLYHWFGPSWNKTAVRGNVIFNHITSRHVPSKRINANVTTAEARVHAEPTGPIENFFLPGLSGLPKEQASNPTQLQSGPPSSDPKRALESPPDSDSPGDTLSSFVQATARSLFNYNRGLADLHDKIDRLPRGALQASKRFKSCTYGTFTSAPVATVCMIHTVPPFPLFPVINHVQSEAFLIRLTTRGACIKAVCTRFGALSVHLQIRERNYGDEETNRVDEFGVGGVGCFGRGRSKFLFDPMGGSKGFKHGIKYNEY